VDEIENDEKVERIKIKVADTEHFDINSKQAGNSDIQLLEDSTSTIENILTRRESLDDLIEDLQINSDIVKKD